MRKIALLITAIIAFTAVFTFSGCETTVSLEETNVNLQNRPVNTTAKLVEETAVVSVTDKDGEVISTQTVTMSSQDKETEKNFFTPTVKPNISTGVSNDRVNQALQQNRPNSVTNPAGNADNSQINPSENANNNVTQNDGAASNDVTQAPLYDSIYVQDDAAVLRSEQYMMDVRLIDANGTVSNYKIAKNGKKSSISFVYNDVPMGFILREDNWYWLLINEKEYTPIPRDMIEENATDDEMKQFLLNDPLSFDKEVKSTSTETIDGVQYNVFTYVDGNKDYFIGKTIIKTVSVDGSVMYYDTLSAVAPASLFNPPADYVEKSLSSESADEMLDVMTTEAQ